jgi:hypothetical protein
MDLPSGSLQLGKETLYWVVGAWGMYVEKVLEPRLRHRERALEYRQGVLSQASDAMSRHRGMKRGRVARQRPSTEVCRGSLISICQIKRPRLGL